MVQNDGVGNIERLHGYRQPQKELYAVWCRHGCCVFFCFCLLLLLSPLSVYASHGSTASLRPTPDWSRIKTEEVISRG